MLNQPRLRTKSACKIIYNFINLISYPQKTIQIPIFQPKKEASLVTLPAMVVNSPGTAATIWACFSSKIS